VAAAGAVASDGDLQGLGCCPGIVRAPVRVVRDPSRAGDLQGHILVAERTDPGWTLLFPTASGLLVQRGSLLSHSAIVAREVGLPCVVAIPGLMDALTDGELVEMNGATGTVQRIAAGGSPA
jgi:pyruvate,water dikinase